MIDSLYFDRAPDVSYTKVKKSYAEIRQILGDTYTASGIVGFILGFIPGAQPVLKLLGGVSAIIGVGYFIVPKDENHGLIFIVEKVKRYRTRMGKRHVYKTTTSIIDVEKY